MLLPRETLIPALGTNSQTVQCRSSRRGMRSGVPPALISRDAPRIPRCARDKLQGMVFCDVSFRYFGTQPQEMRDMRRSLALTLLLALGTAANLFALGEARVNGKITDAVTKAPLPAATVSM